MKNIPNKLQISFEFQPDEGNKFKKENTLKFLKHLSPSTTTTKAFPAHHDVRNDNRKNSR